ncbi:MAG: hypothetical protein WCW31_01860 [Patescibacteria group bacterium]|jgi:hypothetical protein
MYDEKLYYLEKLLVDQINNILDTKRTIHHFFDSTLEELLTNIKNHSEESPSLDFTFFPLFSTTPLNDEILKTNTGSGYIDNKIAKTYQLSRDIPLIIDDARKQFLTTMQFNRDYALLKISPPDVQKRSYIYNVKKYRSTLEEDLFEKNFPIYLKVLCETREALNELRKLHIFRWRLKFDPKYKFFLNKRRYIKAKEATYNSIENYFKVAVEKVLSEINELTLK